MSSAVLIAAAMLASLVFYALGGGADFGGGVWDLLAGGPRRAQQRKLIEQAIGPIWEANHVWLILVVVLLFSAFPPAFAAISVALHIPLTLLLVGIVFRGSAFAFRSSETRGDVHQRRWGLVFSLASILSPLLLGIVVGALASEDLRAWARPFPLAVGLFALSLFAFLAAVYLAHEARTPELKEDFRLRALVSGVGVGVLALTVFLLSGADAPRIQEGLTTRPWSWPLHALTAVAALTALSALWKRRYPVARLAAAAQVSLIVLGWGASQYPYLVVGPGISIQQAAANPRTLSLLLWALAAGSVVLFPSLWLLLRIFKGERGASESR